jgi:hypothetical protein
MRRLAKRCLNLQREMTVAKYASGTKVPADQSRSEIERTLVRFGADQFGYGNKQDAAVIVFRAHGRHIRFMLPLPTAKDAVYRSIESRDREVRRRWRSLAMCIKAKLESVATGIETFKESFMAHVVLPNGMTLAEHAKPLIEQAYADGKMPPLLSFGG